MAKYETMLTGSFDVVLNALHDGIMNASSTASYEDGSDYRMGSVRCAVRVYERYSAMGGNRVSMAVTLVGNGQNLFLSALLPAAAKRCSSKLIHGAKNRFSARWLMLPRG